MDTSTAPRSQAAVSRTSPRWSVEARNRLMSRFRGAVDTAARQMTPLAFIGTDDALIRALPDGDPAATAAFYDRYAPYVLRTLQSTMGEDADIPDILQEVFIRAIDGIRGLKAADRLQSWLTSIAIFTARAHIRRRERRRSLSVRSPSGSTEAEPPCFDARSALHEVYRLRGEMPVDERLAFALRSVEGMSLADAAEASKVSLATYKRRLARAEKRFWASASTRPALVAWFNEGSRWNLLKIG